MLCEINEHGEESQTIVTTHSSMIACSLNLKNVLWIAEGQVQSLRDVDDDVASFFTKADSNTFLQLLLSKKALLVEGATEFILLPRLYNQIIGRSIESDEITIIPCGGISYKRYLEIAEKAKKKVSVLTDNDGHKERIEEARNYNESHHNQHIFMAADPDDWTWEVCFYHDNKGILDDLIKVQPKAQYMFHGKDYGPVLGKMLNNKADTAYEMLVSDAEFRVPQYVRDAIKWLN